MKKKYIKPIIIAHDVPVKSYICRTSSPINDVKDRNDFIYEVEEDTDNPFEIKW